MICSQNKNCTDYGFQKQAFGLFIMAGAVVVAAWLLLNCYIRKIFKQHDAQIAQRDLGVNLDELLPDGFIYIETSSGPKSEGLFRPKILKMNSSAAKIFDSLEFDLILSKKMFRRSKFGKDNKRDIDDHAAIPRKDSTIEKGDSQPKALSKVLEEHMTRFNSKKETEPFILFEISLVDFKDA